MSLCGCKCGCTAAAVIVSIIVGVLAAFLQITGVIFVTPAFLWVVAGVAAVYLGILTLRAGCCGDGGVCVCRALNALLVGILGAIGFALILLAVGITATSILSAILVGLTLFFLSLTIGATACYVKAVAGCGN